jgi:hypothetical protein
VFLFFFINIFSPCLCEYNSELYLSKVGTSDVRKVATGYMGDRMENEKSGFTRSILKIEQKVVETKRCAFFLCIFCIFQICENVNFFKKKMGFFRKHISFEVRAYCCWGNS